MKQTEERKFKAKLEEREVKKYLKQFDKLPPNLHYIASERPEKAKENSEILVCPKCGWDRGEAFYVCPNCHYCHVCELFSVSIKACQNCGNGKIIVQLKQFDT